MGFWDSLAALVKGLMIASCLRSVPYGRDSDLVPNKFVISGSAEDTRLSTGLLYAIHISGHGGIVVTFDNRINIDTNAPFLIMKTNTTQSGEKAIDSILFAFHPAYVLPNRVKLLNKQLGATLLFNGVSESGEAAYHPGIGLQEVAIAERFNFHNHVFMADNISQWDESVKLNFLHHCEASSFMLEETSMFHYKLFNHNRKKALVYKHKTNTLVFERTENPTSFTFEPQHFKLEALITDFRYDKLLYTNLDSLTIDAPSAHAWNFTNESYNETDTHHIQISEKVINTVQWTFSNSEERRFLLGASINAQVEAKFLFTKAKASTTATTSWSSTSTSLREKKTAVIDETSFSLMSDVRVPPRHETEYVLVWKKLDVDISFVAAVKMTALADRLNKDGSFSSMVPVDPDGVMSLVRHKGYRGNLTRVGDDVINYIPGTIHVSGATKGQIRRRDRNLEVET